MSAQYESKLNQIRTTLDTILNNEFVRIYALSTNNPNNTEYGQQLSNLYAKIDDELKNMQTLSKDINDDITDFNTEISEMNSNINNEKTKNIDLKQDLGMTDEADNAAKEMISDYKNIYNQRYLRNWGISLSILACAATFVYINRR